MAARRATSRARARTCTPRSPANASPCAARSACSTPPPSARSRWSGRTPPSSSTASMSTPGQKLAPGRCRYGLLLREDGFVFDDGVIARLAPDRFHVTTTTGGAARVLHMLEDYRQTEWPELQRLAHLHHRALGASSPCRARARATVLAPLVEGLDLSREAFPHMAVGECRVAGVPARLFRVSFTGELGFEVNVPAGHAPTVWEALLAGRPAAWHHRLWHRGDARAARREGLHHRRPGDGRHGDAGRPRPRLGRSARRSAISSASAAWRGRTCGARTASSSSAWCRATAQRAGGGRATAGTRPRRGTPRRATSPRPIAARRWGGRSRSACWPAAGARLGETVFATRLDGAPLPLEVVSPVFLDPEGKRLHG